MPHLSSSQTEVEISLLSLGKILVNRSSSKKENDAMLSLLLDMGIEEKDIKEFFDSQNSIEHIVGNKTFCG